ncbi:methylenetetrahydrofolate reductase [Chloroflexota bacterium]
MHITELIKQGKFVITCEIDSPKGVNHEDFLNKMDMVKESVDAVCVGDNLRAVMRCAPLAMCHLLQERKMEPIMQMNTRDRNRLALQSDLLAAAMLGIENIVATTGYDVGLGDHCEAVSLTDLDTAALVRAAREMNEGRDLAGHTLEGTSNFCVGVLTSLSPESESVRLKLLERECSEGALFINIHPVYQPEVLEEFIESLSHLKLPVIVGHIMLKSASMASFLNSNVPDIHVPENIIKQLEGRSREDLIKISQQITIEFLQKIKPMCQGVHLIPMGWERYVPNVIETL